MNARKRPHRRGVTLLELVMVITIMGILAAIGTARFGRSAYANFGSQGEARTLSLALLRAHRSAIKTGDDHFVQFNSVNPATQYNLMRRAGDGTTSLVEGPHTLNVDVRVVSSATDLNFNFEGEAAAAYQVDFTGNGRKWRVSVVPITGAVVVSEVAP